MIATYDARLVALSIAIASIASYTALDLAGRVTVSHGQTRKLWLAGGAVAMGIGIWSMHFIGMLAYNLPLPIAYDLVIVLISILVAIAASGVALFVVSRQQMNQLDLLAGGIIMGCGIAAMHYTGMAAMQLEAIAQYDPKLLALSVGVAIAVSMIALWLAFHLRTENTLKGNFRKIGSAIIMGNAIAGMHYTGMAAVHFIPTQNTAVHPISGVHIPLMAVVISLTTVIILLLTLLTAVFDRRLSAETVRAKALRQSEERFRCLVQNASDIIAILAADSTISYLSASVKPILGYESEDWLGKKLLELVPPEESMQAENLLETALCTPATDITGEFRFQHANGTVRDFEIIFNNLLSEPSVAGIVTTYHDITERKRTEKALRESEERYALAALAANDGLWDWNLEANEIYFSPRWKAMLGWGEDEIGSSPDEWFNRIHPDEVERVKVGLIAQIQGLTSRFETEYPILHRNGSYRWMLNRGTAMRDAAGKVHRIAGFQTDVTERKMTEKRLLHDALHDTLTGLPNRALFQDRLNHVVELAKRREDYLFAVIFLDLDRFKMINDSLGHLVGDQLLVAIAHRLKICLRTSDTIARLGGDEFAILLEDIQDTTDATEVADRVQRDLTLPFNLDGQEVFTTTSIGIAFSSTGYDRPEDLLRDADTAMYRAKAAGKARYEVFDKTMHTRAVALLQMENDLRRAIDRQEFQLHYQPIVCLGTGSVTGFEALLRWQHPDCGLISPLEFIPVAEETGLIIPIGTWVLREACRQMQIWQQQSPRNPPLTISVNLSGKQFSQPDLIEQITDILQESGLAPQSLKLEITESALLEDPDTAASMLQQLQTLGIWLSVDDFGTGYSSLSYLHRLPINTLKIDRSFINSVDADVEKLELVRTIIVLAWNLGLDVVAEGIETSKQLSQLKALKCESGQGYLFSKPMDTEAATALITGKLPLVLHKEGQ